MRSEFLRKIFCLMAAAIMVTAFACGEEEGDGDGDVDVDGKADQWDSRNNPARFGANMVRAWDELSQIQEGASEIVPWVDTYWPMMSDGYNDRWQSSTILSPAELYDQAFNGWTPPENFFELRPYSRDGFPWDQEYYDVIGPATAWAHEGGTSRARNIHNPDGTLTSQYDADGDGVCDQDLNGDGEADSSDNEGGLAGWFGHCHAWAPASFSHPEPQHSVTVNNTTFEVADIKAMIEATHEGCGGTLFLGDRCNLREMTRDEYGRVVEDECRDTNAGAFHVVITNVVGLLERSFVADITTDYQVWNHPVRDFNISRMDELDEGAACEALGRPAGCFAELNPNATRFVRINMQMRYVVEGDASTTPFADDIDRYTRSKDYDYILEIDANGDVDGGEWISHNQPDFLWAPTSNCDAREGWSTVVVSAANVQTLINQSTSIAPPPPVEGEEVTVNSSLEAPLDIPDNAEAGVSNSIDFPESMTIGAVRVNVNIPHTYIGDLMVTLGHGSTGAIIHNRDGGSQDNLVASFDVDDFNGQDSAGEWTLTISDNAGQDVGQLDNWSVTVFGAVQ